MICRAQECSSILWKSDEWLRGYNEEGTEETPNMDVGKCPLCLQVYERGRTNEGCRLKRCWDGKWQCEAETAIAVQDMHQHSIRHKPVALIDGKTIEEIDPATAETTA